MKVFDFYKWALGSEADFLKNYQSNPTLYQEAQGFWTALSNYSVIALSLCLTISVISVFIYYKPFNELPGRHYHPKWWAIFYILTIISVFAITFLTESFIIKTHLNNVASYEFKLALVNALYSIFLFGFFSWIWCKAFPTNAYRIF